MTLVAPAMPYDVARPPAGARLWLGMLAAKLKISVAEMASAAGVGRTTFQRLLTNEWPARTNEHDRVLLRDAVESLFALRGASPEQLALLWHAHTTRKTLPAAVAASATPSLGLHAQPGPKRRPVALAPDDANPQPSPEDPDMLLPKQTLTPEARRHFKLFSNPFTGEVQSEQQMFDGAEVRYVREAVWQCAQLGGFMALVGESGSGKTTIQTDLEERIAAASDPITVIKPSVLGMEQSDRLGARLKSADILHAIISQLDPTRAMPQTVQARTVAAHKMLIKSAESGNRHLLVIEEAHGVPDETLKHLKRLHELRAGRRPLLGILLLAQPELAKRLTDGLRNATLREVTQRCELVQLLPLDNELAAYLTTRATAAGVKLESLIDQGGIDALRQRLTLRRPGDRNPVSMCYPLAVGNMLTKALNEAARLLEPLVTRDLIANIH